MNDLRTVLAGALIGGALVVGCASEPPAPVVGARPVKMLTLGAASDGTSFEYPGKVQATQNAEMAFEVSGRIIEFPVDEGDEVSEGAVLAILDPRDYQAAVDLELAQQNAARADYDRIKALFVNDAASRQDLDAKRRDFEVTRARVATVRKALEDATLRAPFAGTVAKKLVEDFANVQAKQAVVVLQDDSSLEVVISVPEQDWTRGRRGQSRAEVSARLQPVVIVTSIPQHRFPATIKEQARTADPVTRTFDVTFAFSRTSDVEVLPGMTAKVQVVVRDDPDAGDMLVVPATAVFGADGGGSLVWVIDQDTMTVRPVSVEVGEVTGDQVRVVRGLTGSETIAVSGVHQLREGTQVRRLEQ